MLSTRLASLSDIPVVQALDRAQVAHFHSLDPRLPEKTTLPSWLIMPGNGVCWLAQDGDRVVGAITAEQEIWADDSPFANVFPRQYIRLRMSLAPDGDPGRIMPLLLERVDNWQRARGIPNRMVLLPNADERLVKAMQAYGFRPYHAIAHRPVENTTQIVLPPGVTVRAAGGKDIPIVAELMAESWRFHAEHQPAITLSRFILGGCERQASSMLGDGYSQMILLAERHTEVIGFFAIGINIQDPLARPALFAKGYYGDIYEVAIRSDQRRLGIGTAVFYQAQQWFVHRGAKALFVNYAPTNPLSSRFWPALGFQTVWTNWWL